MGLFNWLKHKTISQETISQKTLSGAVQAGDLPTVQKMLQQGVDPNICDPNDTAYPINYSVHEGPKMVQLLIDAGADVNKTRPGGRTPLTNAEVLGYTEVASILRKAGARIRADDERFSMDPRLRIKIQNSIDILVLKARLEFPTTTPEFIADKIEPLLDYQFPTNMPFEERLTVKKEARVLILEACSCR